MMRGRLRAVLILLAAIALSWSVAPASGTPNYPVKKSTNGRYLVDQDNVPYLIIGDSPQAMMVNITESQAETYFANRQARGFNTVWINLICNTYTGGRANGSMLDGTLPFTGTVPSTSSYDLGTPNEAYFAHADLIISMAASHGIQVFLDPIETGGWIGTMVDNGVTRCRDYGRYLGNRYRDYDNIVWMSGNDFQTWPDPIHNEVARSVALGILDYDTRHLHTLALDYQVSSSLENSAWTSIIGLNATYTYYPTYARLREDYNRPNFLPTFMVEANYEFENLTGPMTTPAILRKQEYWTMTSGATGQLFGNAYIWPFASGWQDYLDTPGAVQMGHLKAFFEPRPWYALVPDTSQVVVTSGYGTYSSTGTVAANDFTTAARTPSGNLVVVYTPVVRTFTVDMTRLNAAATTRWFDPSNGTYATVAGSPFPNTGVRNFTPPGNNADGDGGWVLVLETTSSETVPPTVDITSPAPDAVVSGTVTVAATATDNVGVVGVQFTADGVNIGAEDTAPPYSVPWNTLSASNGSHLLSAIARDAAGNTGADFLTVSVSNALPPPPTDHLMAAYALDGAGSLIPDASGNGNTATAYGATFEPGVNGHAIVFDGAGDHAEAPNSPTLDIGGTGITIACWVWIDSDGGTDYAIVQKPWYAASMVSPYYQYGIESARGTMTVDFYFGDPLGGLHGPFRMSPNLGAWTHIAYTYDGTTVRGYVGGVERLSVSSPGSLQPRGNSLRMAVDGAYQQPFRGAVDDLRIYSRRLTASEVSSTMLFPVVGTTDIEDGGSPPGALMLSAAARNPFASSARIAYTVPAAGHATLQVFDVAGRLVRTLVDGPSNAGRHVAEWNGEDVAGRTVPSRRYFIRLSSGGSEKTISLTLVR